ncbi:lysine-specific demethylase 3A-like [Macrosteles quadrilineatus]|uniref:lysine-specific demethylase 3A-like n=1 Tax=Macrosteles quadrilineatus TaxID=74068 RepID=UPI0023E0F7FB|nr:lysine-specific demethylase 3A-like [Macrosteles quadrilineatus]
MTLPRLQTSCQSQEDDQIEPLDLRVQKSNTLTASPLFHNKPRCRFHHEPLDLRVKKHEVHLQAKSSGTEHSDPAIDIQSRQFVPFCEVACDHLLEETPSEDLIPRNEIVTRKHLSHKFNIPDVHNTTTFHGSNNEDVSVNIKDFSTFEGSSVLQSRETEIKTQRGTQSLEKSIICFPETQTENGPLFLNSDILLDNTSKSVYNILIGDDVRNQQQSTGRPDSNTGYEDKIEIITFSEECLDQDQSINFKQKEPKNPNEGFIQRARCFEAAPKLRRCRECSLSLNNATKGSQPRSENVLCRFEAFRKLRYSAKGFLSTAGFLDPHSDPTQDDLALWQPLLNKPYPQLDMKSAKYILDNVGSQFLDLCKQEKEAVSLHMSQEKVVAWKRPISGCREMCDVCNTTLFNFHWTCKSCGFSVCIDCYKARKGVTSDWMKVERPWLICVNKKPHDQDKLMLTQIIPSDALRDLKEKVQKIMPCLEFSSDISDQPSSNAKMSRDYQHADLEASTTNTEDYLGTFYESLRKKLRITHLDNPSPEVVSCNSEVKEVKQLDPALPRVMTHTVSSLMYPDSPHTWLCQGSLLLLTDPSADTNYPIFQDQWRRGQPVLVSGLLKYLNEDLWKPDSFIKDFGSKKNDLVNCLTGQVIPGQYMSKFWEGFQEVNKMLKDDQGEAMLLKLKDWPPGEDFAEMLPSRFEDLMAALPVGEYTKRTGQLNLPARLPKYFARPDLGPKMYIAYGSAIHPTKGTTNLHLDISDAVNVMVYVGIPKDINRDKFIKEAYQAIDEACVEVQMRRRVRVEMPGAIWHIYSARDANKIRHLLSRVAKERKIKLGRHQDPIHDQNWYLDADLRDRLYREYQVKGYAIVQCLGDAVFIPAGAPHQVQNLLNCVKVAEDFVSPENVSQCLHLTQEFRILSDLHTNHEDKLQIKNIIYHSVKDAISVLSHFPMSS